MGVICFSSLKGGVGKTTLSLNVAGAFAERGCEALLIDLDPSAHTSRFFLPRTPGPNPGTGKPIESPLARLFLSADGGLVSNEESLIDSAVDQGIPFVLPVRPRLTVLPGGPELRHFLWGKSSRVFKMLFPRLIEELQATYDYIIIDTPPDYNVLMRNAIAASDLVVVPVDSSAMSIDCMEELLTNCAHIKGPQWTIIRTMVNRQASRIQKLSTDRLRESVSVRSPNEGEEEEELVDSLDDADNFIAMIEQHESIDNGSDGNGSDSADQSPIYLLNSVVNRTELQNRLSFQGRTAFDTKATSNLAEQYSEVAREVDELLSLMGEEESEMSVADFLPSGADALERSA